MISGSFYNIITSCRAGARRPALFLPSITCLPRALSEVYQQLFEVHNPCGKRVQLFPAGKAVRTRQRFARHALLSKKLFRAGRFRLVQKYLPSVSSCWSILDTAGRMQWRPRSALK
ncbi:hypothetical protein SCHPADRAFT_367222 [Schizopora paradoxa]|uniref:Uncharacterized protein n=1 Tax=Schizopora paradoxa TaxID=27342 RepID=A0A0H2RNH4_9AGAM|nr:hypothetical protein SCHPADRAFT_367222 [Schizopora paradoxa]